MTGDKPPAAAHRSAGTEPARGPARVVDALGKACPLPVIWLAKAVTEAEVGDEVVVLADDPGAKVDIPVWCRMRRQELREVTEMPVPESASESEGPSEDGAGSGHRPGWRFTIGKVI